MLSANGGTGSDSDSVAYSHGYESDDKSIGMFVDIAIETWNVYEAWFAKVKLNMCLFEMRTFSLWSVSVEFCIFTIDIEIKPILLK